MTTSNDAPAFPVIAGQNVYSHGMTLRDWFAGQALAGMLSNCDREGAMAWVMSDAAEMAVCAADALIAALGEKP